MKMRSMILVLLLTSPALADDEDYKLGPDSLRWLWRAAETKTDPK